MQRERSLPSLKNLTCCGKFCLMQQIVRGGEPREELLCITQKAAELRVYFYERPAAAVSHGPAFMRAVSVEKGGTWRQGRASKGGEATSKGRAISGNPKLPVNKRLAEEVILADQFGYFAETRGRKRRDWIAWALPRLVAVGFCRRAQAAALHCSLDTVYAVVHPDRHLEARKHGDREGLPGFGELGDEACCSRFCSATAPSHASVITVNSWSDSAAAGRVLFPSFLACFSPKINDSRFSD